MLTMEPETINMPKEETLGQPEAAPVKSPKMSTEHTVEPVAKPATLPVVSPKEQEEPVNKEQKEKNDTQTTTSPKIQPVTSTEEATAHTEEHPDPAAGVDFKFPALVKEQLKYCATVLKGLKRHPQSSPFQQPVDPVALNIPDYFSVIKVPMDLSAITKKLEGGEYKDADEFVADVRLVLNNCFTYNHPDSQVAKMGHSLEKYFNTSIGKMPTTLPIAGSADENGASRRKSEPVLSAQRARRESHAPSRLTNAPVAASSTPRGRARSSANPEMSFCNGVLRELLKKAHQNVTWPFVEPVDAVKLGIPDYFDVIKQPMDLSTVRRKLDGGQYANAEQFEADVRLIISNCLSYNAPDSDVVSLCRGFERLFDSKWSLKPAHFAPAHHQQHQSHPHHTSAAASYDDDSDSEKILEINRQIQALQQELNTLLMKRKQHKSSGPSGPVPRPKKKTSPATAAPTKPSVITEEDFLSRPMTFEEKRQLSIEVNNLAPEKLGKVVEIIQAGMALEAQGDSDVIELDIESLNVRTLRQLQKYVMECRGITSLAAILGEAVASARVKRKKPSAAAGGSAKKSNSATGTGPAAVPANASAAAAAAMSSDDDEESSDEDLD